MAKFFHLVIEHASRLDTEELQLGFKYQDPSSNGIHEDAKEVIGTASLDFRWQMKHLERNRSSYSTHVFEGAIKEKKLKDECENLKRMADEMAHKKHLHWADQPQGIIKKGRVPKSSNESIHNFFHSGINLVETVRRILQSKISVSIN